MEGPISGRGGRGSGGVAQDGLGGRGRPYSRNKHWTPADAGSRGHTPNHTDSERWERGGHRGGRGRGFPRGGVPKFQNVSLRLNGTPKEFEAPTAEPQSFLEQMQQNLFDAPEVQDDYGMDSQEVFDVEAEDDGSGHIIEEPELDSAEEREKFYQELVKAREIERKKAIAEGKMDDPLVPKRLEDAISIVGTCMDMCPRFERYRRERENNLFEWETIPGTKRVNHSRAVKMYERAAGDKTLPSDLRPPKVLKRTLDYLFHDLLPRGGFTPTFNFIRDRSRSVRNDFTMQHLTGPLAMECHDRCARFHILALHFQRDVRGFSIPLEEQQLMNTLQSLKEFYEDQRGKYQSPTELEMRVYHRLIHIRDQKERHDDIPHHILSDPIFKLTTEFRLHVQKQSAPITKVSKLVVTQEGMQIFGRLATTLNEQGSTVMVYLVACILERLFGKDTIDGIEDLKGGLEIPEVIDGVSTSNPTHEVNGDEGYDPQVEEQDFGMEDGFQDDLGGEEDVRLEEEYREVPTAPEASKPSAPTWSSVHPTTAHPTSTITTPANGGAFSGLVSQPNVFGTTNIFGTTNVFGKPAFPAPASHPATTPVPEGPKSTPTNGFGVNIFPSQNGTSSSTSQKPASVFPGFITSQSHQATELPPGVSSSTTPQPTVQPLQVLKPTPTTSLQPQPTLPATSFENSFTTPTFPAPQNVNQTTNLDPRTSESTPPSSARPLTFPSIPQTSSPSATLQSPPVTFSPARPDGGTPFSMTPSSGPSISSAHPQPPNVYRTSSFSSQRPLARSPLSVVFTKSSTPPEVANPSLSRPSAPPLHKINTNTSSGSASSSSAFPSPRVPPPAPKLDPVSLPATPSTSFINPHVGYLKSSLEPRGLSPWGSSQEILSPLVMGTPTGSNSKIFPNNFPTLSTPQHSRVFRATSPSPSKSNKGKAPVRSMYDDLKEVEEMKKKAHSFACKSIVVKELFSRWMKKATERAAWHEAVKHGNEYKTKLLSQSLNQTHSRQSSILRSSSTRPNTPLMEKKRRISLNGLDVSPSKKRAKKRISIEYRAPRTDDDLAKRFKENHADQEQRWAQGSFLTVIRAHMQTLKPQPTDMPWDIWLSLNPASDATAIWLERKFDMPDSGSWTSESVFSIPLSSTRTASQRGFPGLIVFECTPLGDISDDLEKKFRVLDDCGRLRQLIKSLPANRHFVPSILVITWSEQVLTVSADLIEMSKRLVDDSTCLSYQIFGMTATTKDLDNKLSNLLKSLTLDTEGKLVRHLALSGVFKIFEPSFTSFVDEWIENCNLNMRQNWSLYAQVIQGVVGILNVMSKIAHILLQITTPLTPLPDFDPTHVDDSESAYEDVMAWLSSLDSRDEARMIAMDIQAHRNIGQDFPMRIFVDHLLDITHTRVDRLDSTLSRSPRAILNANIELALESYEEESEPFKMKLLQTYNFIVRRSPKRRSHSTETSTQSSPIAKRARLSESESAASTVIEDYPTPMTSETNGDRSMSPASTVDGPLSEGPPVTVAMLRALTKDLKKKYMGS
ncbi:SAC3/GANP/Nin1/mts3/eIF-3 p25 family-domain-containing protein [Crepidotus variabilis]|uniref:SAC3/GANP/Nin1/mts3/eIF-3 p25 family-domain-containing protein n=1 Tax=Crepidotus variabilis TaxID=179855 RepID=A0A9P6JSE9_9AGAR|nr:SAC3/GANP/Nin1/mts3/eIF-3 p25 family-domain-containing protein [Crepidotus variabilis]